MTKSNDIEKKLKKAFASAAPENFDIILSRCENQKGKVLPMIRKTEKNKNQKIKQNKSPFPLRSKLIAIAASFAIIITAAAGIIALNRGGGINPVIALVSLDVNPSLEMKINCKTEKVLSVNALNDDAKAVIGDMDFKGTKLNVAVNALIGSMLRQGYLNEAANSVLISVDSKDSSAAEQLKKQLTGEISEILNTSIANSAILTQSVSAEDENLKTLAESYGITSGKAQLINAIIAGNPLYTFEGLAGCTVNELSILLAAGNTPHETISAIGSASTKAYIGEDAALGIALADAGIFAGDAYNTEIEFDFDKGRMVYEIEFGALGFEYEYEIDAETGEILEFEREAIPVESPQNTPEPSAEYISEAEALNIALAHAGISESDAVNIKIELEKDRGRTVCEVEFNANGYEYEYTINAATGKILEFEREPISKTPPDKEFSNEPPPAEPAKEYIGDAEALRIALEHAGISESDAGNKETELEKDHGRMIYEIEFRAAGFKYEYTLDARTGEILEFEREAIPGGAPQNTPEPTDKYIGENAALNIALAHAGVSESAASNIEARLEKDKGRTVYEVEFDAGGYEYDYNIDALTGEIVEYESEPTDF